MKISAAALQVLSNSRVDGTQVFLPEGQLDRKLYTTVNQVLEALGGKWNRKVKAHIFDGDPTDTLEQALNTGEVVDARSDLDFFPTPSKIVEHLLEIAEIEHGNEVLEPSAGLGAISETLLRYSGCFIDVCEINPDFIEKLRKQGVEGLPGVVTKYRNIYSGDFLELAPRFSKYDRVVMNPPFSKRKDLAHVLAAAKLLKTGGRLVSVMAAGFEWRTDNATSNLKTALNVMGHWSTEELPPQSFRESGTDVNTIIITFDRT